MPRKSKNTATTIISNIIHTSHQKKLELSEYDKLFPLEADNSGNSVREKALERAWLTRNFEIELYWKRATYLL